MDKKIDVLTMSDMCVDAIVDVEGLSLEFGQKEQISPKYEFTMGGSCSIFAHQTAKLGLSTVVVGRIGTDEMGRFLIGEHEKSAIITDYIRQDPEITTSVSFCLCRKDDRAIITSGTSINSLTPDDVDVNLLARSRHLHIGSFFLLEGLRGQWKKIISTVKAAGGTVSLDMNWDPSERWDGVLDLLPQVDLFFPNEQEAMAVTGETSPEKAAAKLSETAGAVILKRGKKGADLHSGGTFLHQPVEDYGPYIDAIGAGDSFAGGFVYGFLSGRPMIDCLKMGNICGSLNTTQPGGTPGQPGLARLRELLEPRIG
jgi:sugar/nucleoside kinase (ribokinase family)